MPDEPSNHTLRLGNNDYLVTCDGTACTIQLSDKSLVPRRPNESREQWAERVTEAFLGDLHVQQRYNERLNRWAQRATKSFGQDLNKIRQVKGVEFMLSELGIVVVITMAQQNNWGNIVGPLQDVFRRHLHRTGNGSRRSRGA